MAKIAVIACNGDVVSEYECAINPAFVSRIRPLHKDRFIVIVPSNYRPDYKRAARMYRLGLYNARVRVAKYLEVPSM